MKLIGCGNAPCGAPDRFNIAAFAAKGDRVDEPCCSEQLYTAVREPLRTGAGKCIRQLDHEIGAAEPGKPRSREFIEAGGFAALNKAPAHHDDSAVRAGEALCLRDLVGMPVMEGIVFGRNADAFHRFCKLRIVYLDDRCFSAANYVIIQFGTAVKVFLPCGKISI